MSYPDQSTQASPGTPTGTPSSYELLRFPFYATDLPAPLPTVQEILASEDVYPYIFPQRSIRRVGTHFIVKHGAINLHEANNMHFAAAHCNDGSSLRVPRLYAAFHDEPTDADYLIMEYVAGPSLAAAWTDLGAPGRARVATQLRATLDALRAIPSPGFYGRLGGLPYDDLFLGGSGSDSGSDTLPRGPFATEAALHAAWHARYAALHPGLARGRGAYYRDVVFPAVLAGHAPVFTHGDLQAKNVVVRAADGAPCLIDWECAGWYPGYWEYANALWTSRRWAEDDWFRFVGAVLVACVAEFMSVENLLGDLLEAPQPGV